MGVYASERRSFESEILSAVLISTVFFLISAFPLFFKITKYKELKKKLQIFRETNAKIL